MNLMQPYGDGNHRRIKWRKAWDVDREALTALHRDTGFIMAFAPSPLGGYVAGVAKPLTLLGPDERTFAAQVAGLAQLMAE